LSTCLDVTKAKERSAVTSNSISRRALSIGLAALPVGFAIADGPAAPGTAGNSEATADGLSHTAEAIRQQVTLDASPQRVYRALTTTKDFDMITRLSDGSAEHSGGTTHVNQY
jgi:hypothetical protein